jgi:UDP-glucose 4-epimerase
MTYLITGGTGLIGSHIVRDLVREGETVVVFDLIPDMPALGRLLDEEEISSSVHIVRGDITDFPLLLNTLNHHKVDKIIHLAGILQADAAVNVPLAVKVNCEGTVNIFEAAKFLKIKKVVWASTSSIFGPASIYPQEYLPNDAPHFPQSIYGATKSFCENAAGHYSKQYNLDIIGLRYVLIFGPGQLRSSGAIIMRELMYKPAIGQPGRVPSLGVIGWMYVDDAARAAVMASKTGRTKTRAFSIMGEIHSIEEVAGLVKELIPEADIKIESSAIAAGGQTWKYDTRLVEEEIGFRPAWTMKQAVKATINAVRREHGLREVN